MVGGALPSGLGVFCASGPGGTVTRDGGGDDGMSAIARAFSIASLVLVGILLLMTAAIPTERAARTGVGGKIWSVLPYLSVAVIVCELPVLLLLDGAVCQGDLSGYETPQAVEEEALEAEVDVSLPGDGGLDIYEPACALGPGSRPLLASMGCCLVLAVVTQWKDYPNWLEECQLWRLMKQRKGVEASESGDTERLRTADTSAESDGSGDGGGGRYAYDIRAVDEESFPTPAVAVANRGGGNTRDGGGDAGDRPPPAEASPTPPTVSILQHVIEAEALGADSDGEARTVMDEAIALLDRSELVAEVAGHLREERMRTISMSESSAFRGQPGAPDSPGRMVVRSAAFPRSPPRRSSGPRGAAMLSGSVPAEVSRTVPLETIVPVETTIPSAPSGLGNGASSGLGNRDLPPVTPERRTPPASAIGDGISPITLYPGDFPGPPADVRSRQRLPPALPYADGRSGSPPAPSGQWGLPAPPSGGKPARDAAGSAPRGSPEEEEEEEDYVTIGGGADSSFLRELDECEPRTAGRAVVTPERPTSRSLFAEETDAAGLAAAANEGERPGMISPPSRDRPFLADDVKDAEIGQGGVPTDDDHDDGRVSAEERFLVDANGGRNPSAGSRQSKSSGEANGGGRETQTDQPKAAPQAQCQPNVVTPERLQSDDPELCAYASEDSMSEISLTDDDEARQIGGDGGTDQQQMPAYVPPKAPILSIPSSHDSGSSADEAAELARVIAGVAERNRRVTSGKATPMSKRRRRRRRGDYHHGGGGGGCSDMSSGGGSHCSNLLDEVIVEEGELNTSGEPCHAEEGAARLEGGFRPGAEGESTSSRARRGRILHKHHGDVDPYNDDLHSSNRSEPLGRKSPGALPAQITVSAVLGRRTGVGLGGDDPDAVVKSEARGNLAVDVVGAPRGSSGGGSAPATNSAAWDARRNRMARLRMQRAGKAGRSEDHDDGEGVDPGGEEGGRPSDGGDARRGSETKEDVILRAGAIDCGSDEDSI